LYETPLNNDDVQIIRKYSKVELD